VRRNLLLAVVLTAACAQTPPPPAPVQTDTTPSTLPTVTFPDGYVVRVEVVADDESRAQGLMFRDRLREGTGMLFVFPAMTELGFWMKNTLIPLDMIWIDDKQRVVHVKENVPPCKADPCPTYSAGVNAQFVLEVAGGVARQHRIEPGAQLQFARVDPTIAR
jgi:uncharacterized protein